MRTALLTICLLWLATANGNPNFRQGFEFESEANAEGWNSGNATIASANSLLVGSVTEADPRIGIRGFESF